jgi:class 3 adenylate cyclase
VAVVEATEALFVAAIEVMSQKTSVLALGQLASRLIGDDEVRNKILDAAKSQNLPTIIGSPRASFLFLVDLAGSTDLPQDTETKARAYGEFYDAVNRMCLESIGGMIRKTIGDAVIITWDGTSQSLAHLPEMLPKLIAVAQYSDEIARTIGCKGARAILHYGHYFLGLVGTQTFGQIDVIGSGIDEICKMESKMKQLRVLGEAPLLALSTKAITQLPNLGSDEFRKLGFSALSTQSQGESSSLQIAQVFSSTGRRDEQVA